jgi:nucleotide-binding universal stress UspA family protein
MYRTIMVPLDGSDFSRHAIPWALAVARPAGADVHLVHVIVPPYGMGMVDGMAISPVVAVDQRSAQQHDVDLVVMTSHARGSIARAALGSVADVLVRRTRLPVLLARAYSHAPEEREEAAVSDVLVPLDGSDESEAIIDHAMELSALTGASCTLLHVYVDELLDRVVAPDKLAVAAAVASGEAASEAYVAQVCERFQARGVAVSGVVRRSSDAAHGILEYCASHPVSLIAMATRGRHGVARALLGSTATTVLEKTRSPMLLVREREEVARNP